MSDDDIDDLFNNFDEKEPPKLPEGLEKPTDLMSVREWACITLRVPMSHDHELDAIIREARRLDQDERGRDKLPPGICGN